MVDSLHTGERSRVELPSDLRSFMPQPAVGESPLKFGPREGSDYPFEMNLRTGELLKRDVRVNLSGKPFETLRILVERASARDIVTKDEIVNQVWPGVFVDDPEARVNGLIRSIRRALDDRIDEPQFVETRPRRGYRFVGRVDRPQTDSAAYGAERPPINSVAVLPLHNLCPDPSQAYFAEGMTEVLTNNLSQFHGLRVIPAIDIRALERARKTVPQIGRELRVDALVGGAVDRWENRVRITAQLLHVPTDTQLWNHEYVRPLEDVFALQNEIALNIASEIRIRLSQEEKSRLSTPRVVKPEALEAYLKGRYFWNRRTKQALEKAIKFFQQAILEDPEYAEAHAGIADCYNMLAWNSMEPPKQVLPKARAAGLEALKINDQLAEAHSSLAFDLLFQDWNWKGAETEFQRSIDLNPNYHVVRPWLAFELSALGRGVEACAEAHWAVRLDPLAAPILVSAGLVFYLERSYDKAVALCEQILEMDPGFYQGYYVLGLARERKSLFAEAVEALEICVGKASGNPHMLACLGFCLARAGRTSDALKVIDDLKEMHARTYMAPFNLAMVYAGLGDKEQTLEWLDKAYDDHSMWLIFVNVYPIFDFLRPDPRFRDLVRRMGFPS